MPFVTQSDLADLKSFLDKGDRAGFYLKYYDLSGQGQALVLAQISSFSGTPGVAALISNTIDSTILGKNIFLVV
jgi:hypothetical protein